MTRAVLSCFITLAFTCQLMADWPQWRGPGRDGHAVGTQFPQTWPEQPPKPKWTANLGLGYSGAAITRGKLFIHARNDDKKEERCLCLDAATGKQLWEISYPCKFKAPDPTAGKGPNATPTVDRDRVYFFGLGGMLTCADFDTGKVLWQHDCDKEYWGVRKTSDGDDAWFPPCGASASPLVDGDTVIVPIGGKKAGAMTGFDRITGKLLWSALEDRSSYASPLIVSPGGVKQIVGFTGTRMVGLRHSDRDLLWEHPFPTRYEQTIVSPLVWKDLVVFGGEVKPTVAVKLTKDNDSVKKEVAWKSDDLKMYVSSPVPFGDNLIGFDFRTGKLVCVKFVDGSTAWTSSAMGTKHVSLVLAGDVLLTLTLDGELRVAKVSADEYLELAKWKVAEKGTYAHLVVVGNTLFVKGPETLLCYEIK
ncbi:MAG: PQQ-like beta-propeller repeat protein [Planctomycetes bacterium]|nr:PQQ-like beta-propeller repeat protein [Planctomycetota bacterium]